jgi:hypothetical protein
MSRERREENLRQLSARFDDYARSNKIARASPVSPEAAALAQSVYLAHSTSEANFSSVCRSNLLLSPQRLHAEGIKTLKSDSAEAVLGTANAVFLYAAPFRSPATGCGVLFAAGLETNYKEEGLATPFDSGGLLRMFTRADPAEAPAAFLARHELPLPDHRRYLEASLTLLFSTPLDYLHGNDPVWPGPIGLTGGDRRRWTHEVRLPDQIYLRTGYLQAVFVPISRVADPSIYGMLRWCEHSGVDYVPFNAPRGDDFEALKRECVDYIARTIL